MFTWCNVCSKRRHHEEEATGTNNYVAFDFLVDLPLDIAELIFHRMNFKVRVRVPVMESHVCTFTPPPTPGKPWIFLPDIQLVEPSARHLHIPSTVFGDHRFVTSHVIDGSHDRFLLLSRVRRFKA